MTEAERDYRGNQCPSRGPGLTHVTNGSNRCESCREIVSFTPPKGIPPTATQASTGKPAKVWATIYDHLYVMAVTGRCLHANCGEVKEAHATYLIGVKAWECTVNHEGVEPYTQCYICRMVVEPKEATGSPVGPHHGRGRFPFIQRHYAELERIYEGWIGGFYKS